MKFNRKEADVFVPGGGDAAAALSRVTHLCVAAHQDDIEIMAHAGICDCLEQPDKRAFGGVVVTNGAGSPRAGVYASTTDEEMQRIRVQEQRNAAEMGHYAIQLQLAHPSGDVKKSGHPAVLADLETLFSACTPEVLYVHQPADKHDTHVAVLCRVVEALRRVPAAKRPKKVLGCEVWRDLDWLVDTDKVLLDSGRREELARAMLLAFDSQVTGGKRYDLATLGRRFAHATYHTSHAVDKVTGITWAMDLTPAIQDNGPTLEALTRGYMEKFTQDVLARVAKMA